MSFTDVKIKIPRWEISRGEVNDVMPGSAEDLGDLRKAVS